MDEGKSSVFADLDETELEIEIELERYGKNKKTQIKHSYIESQAYRRKFDSLPYTSEVVRAIYSHAKLALHHRSGSEYEDMYWIDATSGAIIAYEVSADTKRKIVYSKATRKAIKDNHNLIAIHTHPSSLPPSVVDFNSCFHNKYLQGYIICHNGIIYGYEAHEKIDEKLFDAYCQEYLRKGYTDCEAQCYAIERTMNAADINFWEVK